MADIVDFFDEFAISPHAVSRNIGTDVEILSKSGQMWIACFRYGQQWARLRIALAKAQKIVGQRGWQDRYVALDVIRRRTAGVSFPGSRTNGQTRIDAGLGCQHETPLRSQA